MDLHFGPREWQTEPVRQRFGDKLLFGYPPMRPDVVSYSRGRLRGSVLTQSNLCIYWEYVSNDCSHMVRKSEAFLKWAKRILDWVRRRTPEKVEYNGYPYRATRRVAHAVRQGTLRVAP
jgi:hypothetical protein